MDISFYRMTGQELELIQKVSDLTIPDFVKVIKMSKSKYYMLTAMPGAIPKEEEIKLEQIPEVSKWRAMLKPRVVDDSDHDSKKTLSDFVKGFTDIIAVMNKKEDNHRMDMELHREEVTIIKGLVDQVTKNNNLL